METKAVENIKWFLWRSLYLFLLLICCPLYLFIYLIRCLQLWMLCCARNPSAPKHERPIVAYPSNSRSRPHTNFDFLSWACKGKIQTLHLNQSMNISQIPMWSFCRKWHERTRDGPWTVWFSTMTSHGSLKMTSLSRQQKGCMFTGFILMVLGGTGEAANW